MQKELINPSCDKSQTWEISNFKHQIPTIKAQELPSLGFGI